MPSCDWTQQRSLSKGAALRWRFVWRMESDRNFPASLSAPHLGKHLSMGKHFCFLIPRLIYKNKFIRARAPTVWGLFLLLFSAKWIGFVRASTCSTSYQTLQEIKKSEKFTYSGVILNGRVKMAQQRHLYTAPEFTLTDLHEKLIHRCIMFRRTKKSQGALWKTQQEARHFAFSGHFGHIPHFYFD